MHTLYVYIYIYIHMYNVHISLHIYIYTVFTYSLCICMFIAPLITTSILILIFSDNNFFSEAGRTSAQFYQKNFATCTKVVFYSCAIAALF